MGACRFVAPQAARQHTQAVARIDPIYDIRHVMTVIQGSKMNAFVVQMQVPGGKIVAWTDAKGDPIKSEIAVGNAVLTQVRETQSHALDPSYVSPALTAPATVAPADFANATAIAPDRPIFAPRQVRLLQAVISGIPANNLLPSDARQLAETLPNTDKANGSTVRFTIRAEQIDPTASARWPVTDPQFKPYLARAAYLETDDPHIRQVATDLRGKETDLYRIASAIRDWVAREMTPDTGIGVPRSARDVFDRRKGICRDYATLFAALARAAGVPTRLCAGIVYNQGRFCYHAWAECYVGRWVAFDPTLYTTGQTFMVDATHIKFAQGDVTQMFDAIAIIGRLKIRIERTM
jgi:transglutaminase-like putative cysteine protease